MTPGAKTSLKLGLFTLGAIVSLVAAALLLGVTFRSGGTVRYHTYFDESVAGLEKGAPVKYRGVTLGTVALIEIAKDRKHVDVTMSLAVHEIHRLGLAGGRHTSREKEGLAVPGALRAQLGTQGITGVKFINLDFFDPVTNPVAPLPFKPAEDTIPAATSLMAGLEQSVVQTLDRMPAVLEGINSALEQINSTLGEINAEHLPAQVSATVTNANTAVLELRALIRQVAAAGIPARTARAVDDADKAIAKLTALLEKLDEKDGLLASAKRAANSVDRVGQRAGTAANELDRTLRDIDDAARAIRDLADSLERDPDMLIKGRAAGTKPH